MGLFSRSEAPLPESVRQKYKVVHENKTLYGVLFIYDEAGKRIYAGTTDDRDNYRTKADKAIRQHEKDGTVVSFGDVTYCVLPWEDEEE